MNIREKFLNFFETKNHQRISSSPLVPEDASLLFNNAGMVQFKSIFTGEIPKPLNPRVTSCQTCLRAGGKHNDLENVGYTTRHHTFFEMLGNFSFGDYSKQEAIAYAWEFLTEVVELSVDKLWVTIHEDDNEARELWLRHIDKSRIKELGNVDNFWQMGDTGPCGPCSEIFYDQGEDNFNSSEDYLGGEGDRFLEIWNLVFMQYEKNSDGKMTNLPKSSIDTGMGLERMIAIKEGVLSNYDSSLFMPIIKEIEVIVQKEYRYKTGSSFRVIADHIRAVFFLLAQGTTFSNEGRGYVLRRILRRAIRHGYLLGLRKPFMFRLVDVVSEIMSEEYSYLKEKSEIAKEQIMLEEARFFKTIESGIQLFEEELKNTKDTFSGEVAFKLYDTFGFPLDLTQDMLGGGNIKLDIQKFTNLMREQKLRAKIAWKGSGDSDIKGDFKELLEKFGSNEFVGYENISYKSKILTVLDESFKIVSSLKSNSFGWVYLDKTPFYAEAGGQVGDTGLLLNTENETIAKIIDTKNFFGLNMSKIKTICELNSAMQTQSVVDRNREEIARHHSATHILHSALYDILGEHISQSGSLVESSRLRFDFSHPKALSEEQLKEVELKVNAEILNSIPLKTEVMDIESAKKQGAKAQFGEKYADEVRVVSFGSASIEFCGGIHTSNSSNIGLFIITKESGVSAGVRRIEAVCSNSAYEYFIKQRKVLKSLEKELKNIDPLAGVLKMKANIKSLKENIKELQSSSSVEIKTIDINDICVVVQELNLGDIKEKIDELKNQYNRLCVILFQVKGDKVLMAAGVKGTDVKAGDWIKKVAPILGGGGGGRADFAQAGANDVSKLKEAKIEAMNFIKKALS